MKDYDYDEYYFDDLDLTDIYKRQRIHDEEVEIFEDMKSILLDGIHSPQFAIVTNGYGELETLDIDR